MIISIFHLLCMYKASGGVEPLQGFAVDSFIMLMSRTISGPAKYYHPLAACTDLEGIGVKVQCKLTFSSQ